MSEMVGSERSEAGGHFRVVVVVAHRILYFRALPWHTSAVVYSTFALHAAVTPHARWFLFFLHGASPGASWNGLAGGLWGFDSFGNWSGSFPALWKGSRQTVRYHCLRVVYGGIGTLPLGFEAGFETPCGSLEGCYLGGGGLDNLERWWCSVSVSTLLVCCLLCSLELSNMT